MNDNMPILSTLLLSAALFFSPLQTKAGIYLNGHTGYPSIDTGFQVGKVITIPFGSQGQIVYHKQTGKLDVITGKLKIISGGYAAVKNGSKLLTSKDYSIKRYSGSAYEDEFGKGMKHVITLSDAGFPEMQQVFYTYAGQEYFFMEVCISGKPVSSNYMSPLLSANVDIGVTGDNRTLFVPFDNDTFISYDAKSMEDEVSQVSAEVGAVYENTSRKGLVIGSVDHLVWKTGIKTRGKGQMLNQLDVWGGYAEDSVTRDKVVHGSISGTRLQSPKIFVGYFEDWREGMETYAKANRIAEKPYIFNWTQPTPIGWNSWGVLQAKLDLDNTIAVADFFADSLQQFRNGNTAYIDLDSYWDNMVQGGLEGNYSKLKEFADHCKSKGLQPGVYWAPFTDWGWKADHERRVEGSEYHFSDIWTKVNGSYHDLDGGRAIDPTHPGTRQRVALVIKKLKECGFKMIKIDFLGHAAIESDRFFDPSVTTGMQAYRKGMEFLLDQLGDQMLVYAAISPSLATGRYAHVRRIACDAFKTIKDTHYTMNSVNYGWWQTYVYNFIDADHVVFSTETEGVNRARLTSGLITGSLFTGDDFSHHGLWSKRAKDLLQNRSLLSLAANGIAFRPVEGNTGDKTSDLFTGEIGGNFYLAVFNYGEEKKVFEISLPRIGLDAPGKYKVVELFTKTQLSLKNNQLLTELGGSDAAIFKFSKY